MTYSLIEKEATIYEQQIDELFNLTELDAKRASKGWEDNPAAPEFLDYKGDLQKTIKYKGRDLTQYQLAVAKDAEASSHWSDVYKRPKPVKPLSSPDTITPDTITHEPVVEPRDDTIPGEEGDGPPLAPLVGLARIHADTEKAKKLARLKAEEKARKKAEEKARKKAEKQAKQLKQKKTGKFWAKTAAARDDAKPKATKVTKPVKVTPVVKQLSAAEIEQERKILAQREADKKAKIDKATKEAAAKKAKEDAAKKAKKNTQRSDRFKELERLEKIRADAEQGQKEKTSKFKKAEYASKKALTDYQEALKNKKLPAADLKRLETIWKTTEAERLTTQDAMKKGRATITGIKEHLIQSEKVDKKIKTLDNEIREQERKHGKNGATEKQITDLNSKKQELQKIREARNNIEKAARNGVKHVTYTIKAGDDLTKIANRHGVDVKALAAANNIKNPNLIIAGTKLNIPIKGDISKANMGPKVPTAQKTKFSVAKNIGPSASNPAKHLIRGKNGQYYLQDPANKMRNTPLTDAQAKIELSKMGAQAEVGAKADARRIATQQRKQNRRAIVRGGAALAGYHMLLSGMNKLAWENFVKKYEEDRNKLPENSPLRKLSPNQFFQGEQFFPGKSPFRERNSVVDKNFKDYAVGSKGVNMTMSPLQMQTRNKTFKDKFATITERDINKELFLSLDQRDEQFEIIVQKPDGSYINITDQEKRAKKRGEVLDPNTFINAGDVVIYTQSISDKVAKETWANMAKQGTKGTASWLDIKYNMRTSRMKVFYMTRGNKDHLDKKYHAGGTHEKSLNSNWDPSDYVGKRADELGNEQKLGVGLFSKKGFRGNINMEKTWREHNELMKEFRAAELEAVRKGQPFDPSSILKKFGMTEDELFALLPAESALGLTGDESPVTDYVDDTISDFGKWTGLYDYQSTSGRQIDRVVNSGLEGDEPSAIAGQGIASSGWPADTQTYNTLITKLGIEYKIDPKLLKALSQKESGTGVFNGKLKQGKFKGDTPRGTRGAWGLFHVRKGEIRQDDQGKPFLYDPAVVDEYNLRHSTLYQWADVAGDALLAAHIGADTFAVYYKEALETNSDPMKAAEEAYAKYNGGPEWRNKSDAKANAKIFVKFLKNLKFTVENKIYTKKSAILEGIAIAA